MSTEKSTPSQQQNFPSPGGPQGVDKDPEQDKPGEPGSDFEKEQKGKKVDANPQSEADKPTDEE